MLSPVSCFCTGGAASEDGGGSSHVGYGPDCIGVFATGCRLQNALKNPHDILADKTQRVECDGFEGSIWMLIYDVHAQSLHAGNIELIKDNKIELRSMTWSSILW